MSKDRRGDRDDLSVLLSGITDETFQAWMRDQRDQERKRMQREIEKALIFPVDLSSAPDAGRHYISDDWEGIAGIQKLFDAEYRGEFPFSKQGSSKLRPDFEHGIVTVRPGYTIIERRYSVMPTTEKQSITETRDAFTNEQKKRRGDFLHGANWALKNLRENPSNRRFYEDQNYYRSGGVTPSQVIIVPTKDQIEEAARERYPLEETRDRIVSFVFRAPGARHNVTRYARMENGEVRFFEDGKATIRASVPPMLPDVVKVIADLAANPTEIVKV